MFWAMMYLLFFSGSAAPELPLIPNETVFRKAIAEQQRLEQVLVIRDEIKAAEQRLTDLHKDFYEELAHLSPQHETGSRSVTALFDRLEAERTEIQALLMDQRFHLQEHMTEKEWHKVFRSR